MSKLFQQIVDEKEATPALRRLRSAALVLHGMSEADRAWALAELSEEERDVLQPLIDELQSLGVPADTDWASSALGAPARAARGREAPDPNHRRVARAQPEQVAAVLLDEPVELIRRVLGLAAWPWRAEVVAVLNARRGDLFESDPTLAASDASSALDRALLARVAQQLSRASHGAHATTHGRGVDGAGWLARLRDWMGARGARR